MDLHINEDTEKILKKVKQLEMRIVKQPVLHHVPLAFYP